MLDPALIAELERISGAAAKIALRCRQSLVREFKPDGSIVTNADREVERFLRGELTQLVGDSTVWGEEQGREPEGAGGLWVVDPIDGTSNFSFGSPLWGVSIALVKGSFVEVGTVVLPDLNEHYVASRGRGAKLNDQRLSPIAPGPIKDYELVSYCDGVAKRFPRQIWPGKMRCAGAFVIDACWVAAQRYRGMIGMREKLYDIGASILICSEVGAEVRYADGSPMEIEALKEDVKIDRPWLIFPSNSGFFSDAA